MTMKECFIIYDFENHKVWSESENMWSICHGTFYPTIDDAHAVVYENKFDLGKVGTIHLYNF